MRLAWWFLARLLAWRLLAAYKYLLVIGEGIAIQQTISTPGVMSLTRPWCLSSQTAGPGGSSTTHGV
jgi:hypothetical protein